MMHVNEKVQPAPCRLRPRTYREALVWVLYELDINPENAAAVALRLKLRHYRGWWRADLA